MQDTIHSRDIVYGLKANKCLFFQLGDSFVCARKQENGKWQIAESRKKLADLIAVLEAEWKKVNVKQPKSDLETFRKAEKAIMSREKKDDDIMFTLAKWCILYVLIASFISLFYSAFLKSGGKI